MSEHVQQVRHIGNDGSTTRTTRVIDDDNDQVGSRERAEPSSNVLLARIVWFIGGVLAVILAFRFVLVLLGANSGNSFVNFIYTLSHPFASPFFGLFNYRIHYGISRFEISTLVAIVVYLLIAYGIARLLTINRPKNDSV